MYTYKLSSILILTFALIFGSCGSVNDSAGDSDGGDQPWERQFQFGNFKINGTNVLTSESSTMEDHIMDTVCYSNLPSGALNTFSINLYVPTHANSDYQSGGQAIGMTVFYNGSQTPKINNDFIFVRKETFDGVAYSKFLIGGRYSDTDLTRNNFQQFRYDFDMIYKDNSGEEIRRDQKTVTINIEDCGSGSGNNDTGGGDTGGGTGDDGTSTLSDIMFYVKSDLDCGYIDVTLENQGSETISTYYTSAPDCGAEGTANFIDLEAGTYSYSASCSGTEWNGTVTIDEGVCYQFEL